MICALRMLGTFNQHLPMILSDNYYSQRKPTSLLDTGMGGVPYSGSVKCLESTDVSCNM